MVIAPPLRASVAEALALRGVSLDALERCAGAIALFGSRAGRCERPSSDWDLLAIGDGAYRKRDGLDLVWVRAEDVAGDTWLGGDLAGHVLSHGIWLRGEPSWRLGDLRFDLAVRRKQQHLIRSMRSLGEVWDILGPGYQRKHATLLRRDVQRLHLLARGVPVPPSAHLDASWTDHPAAAALLQDTLRQMGAHAPLAAEIVARVG